MDKNIGNEGRETLPVKEHTLEELKQWLTDFPDEGTMAGSRMRVMQEIAQFGHYSYPNGGGTYEVTQEAADWVRQEIEKYNKDFNQRFRGE